MFDPDSLGADGRHVLANYTWRLQLAITIAPSDTAASLDNRLKSLPNLRDFALEVEEPLERQGTKPTNWTEVFLLAERQVVGKFPTSSAFINFINFKF